MADILKKNILSILCGVVVLIAVAAYFFFVTGLFHGDGSLEAKANERKEQYERLNTLVSKTRNLPLVDLETPNPVPMQVFPTEAVIQAGQQVTDQLKAQAEAMEKEAAKRNQRPPLLAIFPKPNDIQKIEFRGAYEAFILEQIPKLLQAGTPPTEEQVAEAEDRLWNEKYADQIYTVEGKEVNRPAIEEAYKDEITTLRDTLEKQIATKNKMYLDADAISVNAQLFKSADSAPTNEVWYAQTALWVQHDVVRSIADLNKNAKSVTDAPVKHLVQLKVLPGKAQYIMKAAAAPSGDEGAAAAPTGPDYTLSPTGRICNSVYDVVQFELIVKMDGHYVPTLVQELSRDKFVTVHKVELTGVDTELARVDGYYYGKAPMVQATITGEGLLLHKWTEALVPDVVKKEMPGYATPAATPAETPAAVASGN